MIEPVLLEKYVSPAAFVTKATRAVTSLDVKGLLSELPIASEVEYSFGEDDSDVCWQPDKFH